MRTLNIHIDGAARGNPGPAAFAYVIARDGQPPVEEAECLGETTNNVAEYTALVRALERAAELGADRLVIHSDSELLVKQMNGEYKVKNAALRELYDDAQELVNGFQGVTLQHVRREQNKRADQLCNNVLDGRPLGAEDKPAATTASQRKRTTARAPATAATRQQMLAILRETAVAWGRAKTAAPTPEEVCDEIWGMLLAEGVLDLRLGP